MKGTEEFKKTIQNYLEKRVKTDELFAKAYAKPDKNMDECVAYILNEIKNSQVNGLTDEEVYGLAVHYYNEDNIETGKAPVCRIIANHYVELTEKEKEYMRQKALRRVENEAYEAIKRRIEKKRKAKENTQSQQLTLF